MTGFNKISQNTELTNPQNTARVEQFMILDRVFCSRKSFRFDGGMASVERFKHSVELAIATCSRGLRVESGASQCAAAPQR